MREVVERVKRKKRSDSGARRQEIKKNIFSLQPIGCCSRLGFGRLRLRRRGKEGWKERNHWRIRTGLRRLRIRRNRTRIRRNRTLRKYSWENFPDRSPPFPDAHDCWRGMDEHGALFRRLPSPRSPTLRPLPPQSTPRPSLPRSLSPLRPSSPPRLPTPTPLRSPTADTASVSDPTVSDTDTSEVTDTVSATESGKLLQVMPFFKIQSYHLSSTFPRTFSSSPSSFPHRLKWLPIILHKTKTYN